MSLVSGIPLFVVPRRNQAMLCTVEDRRLVEINPVPVPIYDEYNLQTYEMSQSGWIAWIHPEDLDHIGCFHSDAEPDKRFPSIPLPKERSVTADALAFHGDVLYVAARPAAGLIDFRELALEWQPWPGVETGDSHGGLACCGEQLIVGEMEGPDLALHAFDVTDPRHPTSRERRAVIRDWNSESFTRIVLGKTWLAALVVGWGLGGEETQIRFFDPSTLQEYGAIGVILAHSFLVHGAEPPVNPPQWSDIGFLGDILFIAAGPRGVGILDMGGLDKPPQPRRSHEESNRDFNEACQKQLLYLPLAKDQPGAVLRVFPVPTTGQVIAVLRTDDGFDSVLFDLPRAD
jgi:hypothetical protein